MEEAIKESKKALANGEVPVGAVIVKNGKIIARGYNCKEQENSPIGHAEIKAITAATQILGNWRLTDCSLYVTLEPCVMCCGAILQSRIEEVIFGAWDLRWGGAGTIIDVLKPGLFNHTVKVTGGIKERVCSELLSQFFTEKRTNKEY